ncbi:hypothetical protein PINS_up001089 [Pythium insidiosum]|nr:hypothetical protein PINS_up001089 [Pythium insidiosum]
MAIDAIEAPVAVAVLGHVDSGKSTLIGQLLVQTGMVSTEELSKTAEAAENAGKADMAYAWLTDRRSNERERGITVDFASLPLRSSRGALTIVNTPGHTKYLKHAVWGTSTADCALIVVSAPSALFAAEFYERSGQVQEFCKLAFAQGIRQLVIAVNKMDDFSVVYEEAQFRDVADSMLHYLRRVGFKDENVTFVPTSAWSGENLTTPCALMSWYKGPTLLDALHNLQPPRRFANKPLRMPIQATYNIRDVGHVLFGRVETGVVRRGMAIVIGPNSLRATVLSIHHHQQDVVAAGPGCHVGICIGESKVKFRRGMVVSDPKCDPAVAALSVTAQLVLLHTPSTPFKSSASSSCTVTPSESSAPCQQFSANWIAKRGRSRGQPRGESLTWAKRLWWSCSRPKPSSWSRSVSTQGSHGS